MAAYFPGFTASWEGGSDYLFEIRVDRGRQGGILSTWGNTACPDGLVALFLGARFQELGFWDPMSCHYNSRESPPPGISSWTKLRLGWLDPSKVRIVRPGEATEVILSPLEKGEGKTLAVKMPLSGSTYYLFENRQAIGYDANLPGKGMLVMFADDGVAECRRGKSPVKLIDADPATNYLQGAAFLPGKKELFRDESRNLQVRVQKADGDSLRLRFGPCGN